MDPCRICLELPPEGELIAPCLCSGSLQWVHRECLDEWRAINASGPAFRRCGVCQYDYQFESADSVKCAESMQQRWRVVGEVAGGAAVVVGAWLALAGLLTFTRIRERVWDSAGVYPLASLLLLLAGVGVFGLLAGCHRLDERWLGTATPAMPLPEARPSDLCYTDHHLFRCLSPRSSSSKHTDPVCVLAVLVVLVLAVFGLFYGIFYGSVLLERVVARHVKRKWNRAETDRFPVKDLSGDMEKVA